MESPEILSTFPQKWMPKLAKNVELLVLTELSKQSAKNKPCNFFFKLFVVVVVVVCLFGFIPPIREFSHSKRHVTITGDKF